MPPIPNSMITIFAPFKASGLRWSRLMLLTPWASAIWALPFLTALAPSEGYHQARGKRPKTVTDWTRQMLRQVRRWLPDRDIVVVGDNTYAVLDRLVNAQRFPSSRDCGWMQRCMLLRRRDSPARRAQ